MNNYWVYILTSDSGTLYTGATNDIVRRVLEHKRKLTGGFTARYAVNRPVYLEQAQSAYEAIAREKESKGWRRARKVALIESANPKSEDLSAEWYSEGEC